MANASIQFTRGKADESEIDSVKKIQAAGAIKVQSIALHWVGSIICILSLGGMISFYLCPDKAKDLWTVIAPIILAAITGTLGFLAGEKSAKGQDSQG